MNKQAMYTIRKQAQAGFTLIELIVVIVILGILAATALPKFASMGADARVASLNAARGALSSTVAMVHGQSLANPALNQVVNEGVTIVLANGYPNGATTTADGAGLTAGDYARTASVAGAAVDTTNHVPAIPVNGFVIVPNSVVGTATAQTCFISYAASTTANTPPVISATPTVASCQ